MTDKDRKDFGVALLRVKRSLDRAVTAAGGSPEAMCSIEQLERMPAIELMCHLATNHIRFMYEEGV